MRLIQATILVLLLAIHSGTAKQQRGPADQQRPQQTHYINLQNAWKNVAVNNLMLLTETQ